MRINHYILSIDIGTSSCKLCLVDQKKKIIAASSYGYNTYSEKSGWAEQEPEDWLTGIRAAAGEIFGKHDMKPVNISAVVLTSAAHIGVMSDSKGNSIRRSLLWSDQRSKNEVLRLNKYSGDKIYKLTFNRVSTTWTLPHILWIKDTDPETWNNVRHISLSKDFVLFHLIGKWVTDPATAVSSMLCDSNSMTWSKEIGEIAGINTAMLPEIIESGEIAGTLNSEGAELLSLTPGIPVINGTLDSAMETYGAGALNPGDCVIRIGTAGGIHIVKSAPRPDANLLTYPYPEKGVWYSQAGTNSAGSSIRWALEANGEFCSTDGFNNFDAVAAEVPPGCDGLMFHPYLSGERTPYWNSELRGTFSGISFLHTKAHFARAILEGVAFSLSDALYALSDVDKLPEEISVVGGGAEDHLLMEILSSVTRKNLISISSMDSAYGAALFALNSTGIVDMSEVSGKISEKIYKPDEKVSNLYQELFDIYQKYARQLVVMYGQAKEKE